MSLAPDPDIEPALDAYSRIVTAVAADLTPHVAALQVTGPDGRSGAGSAVVVSDDGLMLTNAHVVSRAARGVAVFSDGSEADVVVVGARRPRRPSWGTPVR
jgi:S1-C subfamily serine protease